jgi:hypothetical protein
MKEMLLEHKDRIEHLQKEHTEERTEKNAMKSKIQQLELFLKDLAHEVTVTKLQNDLQKERLLRKNLEKSQHFRFEDRLDSIEASIQQLAAGKPVISKTKRHTDMKEEDMSNGTKKRPRVIYHQVSDEDGDDDSD